MPPLPSYGVEWGVGLVRESYPTTTAEAIVEVRARLEALQPPKAAGVGGVAVVESTYRSSFSQSLVSPEAGLSKAFKVPRSGI